jgi:hypothetical protein
MTTTANGSPKALSFVAGKENPGVNITGTGLFTVNLLFEAFAGGSWQPFLNVFDSLLQNGSTLPSPGAGPATTSLQVGFYYTTGTTTDDAAAHAALQADVTGLKADTTILKTDTTTLKNGLASVQVTLAALSGQVAALATLTAPDLTGLQTSLTTALQQIGNANTKLDQVQDLLQDSSVLLDVQPFKEYRTDGKRAWLLKTSSHGQLVDSTLTTAFIVKTPPSGPSIVQDATSLMATLPIGTGLLEVTYIGPAATVQVFQFNLQATVNSVVVTGSTLTP